VTSKLFVTIHQFLPIIIIYIKNFSGLREELIEVDSILKESIKKYQFLVNNILDIITEIDLDGTFSYVSPRVYNIFGYRPEEVIGNQFFGYIHPDDMPKIMEAFEKAVGGEEIVSEEYRIRHKEGHYISVYTKGSLVKLDDKIKIVGVIRDITQRKIAEQKLKDHARTLEILNKIITFGNESTSLQEFLEKSYYQVLDIVAFDRGGVYLYDPKTQHNILVLHKNVHPDFIAAVEDVDISKGLFAKVFDKNNPYYIEDFSVFMENSKEVGVYSAVIVPLRSKDEYVGSMNIGSPVHQILTKNELKLLVAIGKQMGIVIQKFESEKLLTESKEKYRDLFESSPNAIVLINLDGKIIDCNKATEILTKYGKQDIINKNFSEIGFFKGGALKIVMENLEFLIAGKNVRRLEIQSKKKDGTSIWIMIRASVINIGGQILVQAIIHDITERKKAERELKEISQLKTELIERTSHELKTPLISIKGFY